MEPSWNKGIFAVYSETTKAFRIYVPSERYVEVTQDVTSHEEVTFNLSKELEFDTKTEDIDILNS